MTETKLAQMTGTSQSNVNKFIKGNSNGTLASLKKWLDACESHSPGARRKFYLICLEEGMDWEIPPLRLKARKFTIQDHVNEMDLEQISNYMKAMADRVRKQPDILMCQHSDGTSSSENPETDYTED